MCCHNYTAAVCMLFNVSLGIKLVQTIWFKTIINSHFNIMILVQYALLEFQAF